MKTSLGSWLLAGALIASTGVNVYLAKRPAPTPPPATCETCPGAVCPDVDRLGLTDTQCDRLTSCCRSQTPKEEDHAAAVARYGRELETLLATSDGPIDVAKAEALADEIGQAQAQLLKSRIKTIGLVREELTPEQLRTLIRETEVR